MSKDLPYFKFRPSKWISGDITMMSFEAQGVFTSLCAYYWDKQGDIDWPWVQKRFRDADPKVFQDLIKEDVIRVENDKICIEFLDEQLSKFSSEEEKKSERALKGWETRKKNQAESTSDQPDIDLTSTSYQLQSIKEKEEEKEEEKESIGAKTPTLPEVEEFFFDNGYSKESAKKAFDYYDKSMRESNGRVWKDSQGRTVKNWKQKMRGVWFKPENKIRSPDGEEMVYRGIKNYHQ